MALHEPIFSGKNQNNLKRTEGRAAFEKSGIHGIHEMSGRILNFDFVTGWHYIPRFSGKKNQNDPIRTEREVAI